LLGWLIAAAGAANATTVIVGSVVLYGSMIRLLMASHPITVSLDQITGSLDPITDASLDGMGRVIE
jgi:hypothetical protein